MPISVGVDLIEVSEIEASLERFGERYLGRLFTPGEVAACSQGRNTPFLAACVAAKEAAIKALGIEDEAAPWQSIEVRGLSSRRPVLAFSGGVSQLAERAGLVSTALSIDATRRYAAAVVIVDTRGGRPSLEA